jgi:site-specific DNA-methyltransferase (adenine-specific)
MLQNNLFYGDNLNIMRDFIKTESVDLCYIDPPFNSKRNYNQIYSGAGHEDIAQSQAFVDTWSWNKSAQEGFEEILHGANIYTSQTIALINGFSQVLGRTSMLAYIVSMTQRIQEIWRVLKKTGSFYLHCDQTMSHYLKLVLDSVFVARGGGFLNEIVWCYKRWTNSSEDFQKMHDSIFRYSKTKRTIFNKIFESIKEKISDHFTKGYTTNTVKQGGKRITQLLVYDETKAKNKILEGKYDKLVLRSGQNQTIISDWWEIPVINSQAKERLGYPTQKPEKLLERIIKASSNEGDTVLDAYCGCGTTASVAYRLNRRFIGIDITYQAISLIKQRLEDSYGKEAVNSITVTGEPEDIESAQNLANNKDDRLRKEFEKWAILKYSENKAVINEKKGKDYGIDGIAYVFGKPQNKILFSVKSGKVNSSQIRDFRGTIERENAIGGVFITLKNPTKDMREEAVKAGILGSEYSNKKLGKIEIITVQEILDGARLNVYAAAVVKSAPKIEKEQGRQICFAQ